jgi:hypothetical protein
VNGFTIPAINFREGNVPTRNGDGASSLEASTGQHVRPLFSLRQPDRHVRRGADDPWTSVGVALVLEQRFEQQEEFFGKHEKALRKFIRQAIAGKIAAPAIKNASNKGPIWFNRAGAHHQHG